MRDKLIDEVARRFAGAPATPQVRELRDEILNNTLQRFDDLVAGGMPEQAAYAEALESVGDVEELLAAFRSAEGGHRRKNLVALAVPLYILSVVPVIALEHVGGWAEDLGICLMFVLIAVATALLILGGGRKRRVEHVPQDSPAERQPPEARDAAVPMEKQPKRQKQPDPLWSSRGWRIFLPVFWGSVSCLALAIGSHGLWQWAWLVFPFARVVQDLVKVVMLASAGRPWGYRLCGALLWLAVNLCYLFLTLATGNWLVTWLLYPIGGALGGVLNGIFTLAKGERA